MYVDPETPVNCIFTARINGEIPEENFRTALAKIQKKHPLLRVRIDNSNERYPFFIEEEIEPIPLRIVERQTDEDWLQESEKEWFLLFDDEKKPLARLVWIKGMNNISEILWILPHCICDGTSIVNLMKELLSMLDDPSSELGTYHLFSSADDFLPLDFNTKKKKRKARLYLIMARLFFLMQRKSQKNPGKNYVIHWKLNTETTTQITEKSKVHGISVHALLCASCMQSFKEIQGKQAKGKVISPVDVRHFIPEIRQDHVFAFAPTVELSLKKGNQNILDHARQIKKDLVEKIEKMEARELLWMGEQMHPVVKNMIAMLKSGKGGHDVTLSNMGKINIPDTYKNFKVESIMSPTVAFPWLNSNTLVATTYNRQMDFTFMSNEYFLPKEEAVRIKDKAIELLISSL